MLLTRESFLRCTCFLSATVWYTLTQPLHIHSHLATATSAAQLAAGTARQLRCTSVVTAEREGDLDVSPHVILPVHYLQSVLQRHNRISRHLFTSPSTSGDEWNQYPGSCAISPSHRQPQVYIIVDLYSAELIMRHSADLLTWKIGNYGRQSAVLVECRYCKPLTILWNCYSKHRGSTMPQNQCSS